MSTSQPKRVIPKHALSKTSCDTLLSLALAGATNITKDIARMDHSQAPGIDDIEMLLRQCKNKHIRPLVRVGNHRGRTAWVFTTAGFALVHHWLDQGQDSRDREFSAEFLAKLRPAMSVYGTRVREFDLDDMRRW